MIPVIPVVLFVYARYEHLERVLVALRENQVPHLEVFADGPKDRRDEPQVARVRGLIRGITWCSVRLTERPTNMGLGKNVLAGVSDVAERYDAFIVWEDDLVAVRGTYAWVCAALRAYGTDSRVMSATAWTHPRVTPRDVGDSPYFDGRAECWVWGTWSRAWRGMEGNALVKLRAARKRGIRSDAYGSDLKEMAEVEERRNIWAVRWLYHHLQHRGLCVRPPWSMIEHIGLDVLATNSQFATEWCNPPLQTAPPIPVIWPEPIENPQCRRLWQVAYPSRKLWQRVWSFRRRLMRPKP